MKSKANKTLLFTRTLSTDEDGNTTIVYWNEDEQLIMTTEDLVTEIPYLLADGYKVKVIDEVIIENYRHLCHFQKMRDYEKKIELRQHIGEVRNAN